jgi:hypothetical protein
MRQDFPHLRNVAATFRKRNIIIFDAAPRPRMLSKAPVRVFHIFVRRAPDTVVKGAGCYVKEPPSSVTSHRSAGVKLSFIMRFDARVHET